MITQLTEWLSVFCLLMGSFLCFSGGVGLFRFPDFFTRMHAAGVTDSLGALLILLGLMLNSGWTLTTAKLFSILLFLLLTAPAASHALAKAALRCGERPMSDKRLSGNLNSEIDQVTQTGEKSSHL